MLAPMLEEATSRLAGVWRVVAVEDRPGGKGERVPYGSDPEGIIIYDISGTMSAHLVADGPLPSAAAYLGYWGTFRVVEAKREAEGIVGVVEHHMVGGSTSAL
jgi:hypothetical protein